MKPAYLPLLILAFFTLSTSAVEERPAVMLASTYSSGISVSEYWVSEKLDGVRARWNGEDLISRGGNRFAAPEWFTQGFPNYAIDGELWLARGQYELTSSITSRAQAHDGWQQIRFMAFDLPNHGGSFSQRVAAMSQLSASYLVPVEQFRVTDNQTLMKTLDDFIAQGAEGLMLHHQDAFYRSGRSSDLLKLKRFTDAEAVVLEHIAGKGKYSEMTGSLKVEDSRGKIFKVGSGLSDQQRRDPPAIGSTITFKHQGFTGSGIPRFPVFVRVRDELQ